MLNGSLSYGLRSPLMGAIQTVHRGEAAVVVILLTHVARGANVNYFSDNHNFVDAFKKGFDFCRTTLNSDIYIEIFTLIHQKGIVFTPHWMPSHLLEDPKRKRCKSKDPKPTPDWVQRWHIIGNYHADLMATEACKAFDVEDHLAYPIISRAREIKLVQARISSIICHLPHRPKVKNPPKVPRSTPTTEQLLFSSSHTFSFSGTSFQKLAKSHTKLTCMECRASCSFASGQLKAFLKAECLPCLIEADDRVHGNITINDIVSHFTHKLILAGDTYVCVACGYRATDRINKLQHPCNPNTNTYYKKHNIELTEAGGAFFPDAAASFKRDKGDASP